MTAESISRALGGRKTGAGWMARCPVPSHGRGRGDRRPSLSICDDDALLVHCHGGCGQDAVIDALKARGLWNSDRPNTPSDRECHRVKKSERHRPVVTDARQQAARALWHKSVPTPGTRAHAYLRSRGITIEPPPSLRFLPDAKHGPTGLILPVLLAAVTHWPRRRVAAVHRKFLQACGTGKARVSEPRMALGPMRGGAVRLAPAGPHLALCEGIEDGLSITQATVIPAWACLGTSGLRAVVLPSLPTANTVTIFADGDEAGERAARELAERLAREGRRVSIARPPLGKDFNDTLRAVDRSAA